MSIHQGSNVGDCTQLKDNAVQNSVAARSESQPALSCAFDDSSEALDTGLERKIHAVGSALVDHVEGQARVVDIVVSGEVVALSNVDAQVVCTEAVQGVVGDDFGHWRSGHVADEFAEPEAWLDLVF